MSLFKTGIRFSRDESVYQKSAEASAIPVIVPRAIPKPNLNPPNPNPPNPNPYPPRPSIGRIQTWRTGLGW